MTARYPDTMRVEWLIGERGAVKAPHSFRDIKPAELYKRVDPSMRYAVGWNTSMNGDGRLLVMDLYASVVTNNHPYVEAHWVEDFDGIDHAIAALTLTYQMSAAMRQRLMVDQRRATMRTKDHDEDEFKHARSRLNR